MPSLSLYASHVTTRPLMRYWLEYVASSPALLGTMLRWNTMSSPCSTQRERSSQWNLLLYECTYSVLWRAKLGVYACS